MDPHGGQVRQKAGSRAAAGAAGIDGRTDAGRQADCVDRYSKRCQRGRVQVGRRSGAAQQ
jgi:hypothetical protein